MIGATVATAILGAVIEIVVIRRLYGRAIDDTILATWGVSLILIQSISWIFGREPVGLAVPIPGGILVFGIDYPGLPPVPGRGRGGDGAWRWRR